MREDLINKLKAGEIYAVFDGDYDLLNKLEIACGGSDYDWTAGGTFKQGECFIACEHAGVDSIPEVSVNEKLPKIPLSSFLKTEVNPDNIQWVNPPLDEHYDNTKGTLYKIAIERGWNAYQFDAIKRIDRAEKKGQFEEDIRKTKTVLEMWEQNK